MSATQSVQQELVHPFDAHQQIRDTLQALPGYVTSKLARMGEKEDCWCIHGFYTVARLQVMGLDLFPKHRWLQVLGERTADGTIHYQLFASSAPALAPAWTGQSFDDLLQQIPWL